MREFQHAKLDLMEKPLPLNSKAGEERSGSILCWA